MVEWLYEKITGRCWHNWTCTYVGYKTDYKCMKCGKVKVKW